MNIKNPFRSLLSRYRDYRDRKFRERIDRVYFHVDEHGNRFFKGSLYAVKDEETGAAGIVCANPTITLEEVKRVEWGQSFDGESPFFVEGYFSVIGSNKQRVRHSRHNK